MVTMKEIKDLYNWCKNKFHQEVSKELGIFIASNIDVLEYINKEITNQLYDENKDPKFIEYRNEMNKLFQQYSDRDEQGTILTKADGSPQISEMIVEFDKEEVKVRNKYKDTLEKYFNKDKINESILNQEVSVGLLNINIVDGMTPYIIGIIKKCEDKCAK